MTMPQAPPDGMPPDSMPPDGMPAQPAQASPFPPVQSPQIPPGPPQQQGQQGQQTDPNTRSQAIEVLRQRLIQQGADDQTAIGLATELVDQAIAQRGG